MTALTVTAANVRPLNGAVMRRFVAGGAITVGNLVYIASDGDVEKADANLSQAGSKAVGLAVESYDGETTINAGDPVTVVLYGPVSGFSDLTPGANGYVSDTAGAIDDAAGTYDRIVGFAESATVFFVNPEMNDPSSS